MCTLLNTSSETVYSLFDLIIHPNTPKKISEPQIANTSALQCMSGSGAMEDVLNSVLPNGYDEVEDLTRIGNTPFLYNGLNMLYGIEGSGKSWQTASSLKEIDDVVYIDTDGSNGKMFVNHCRANGVAYIKNDTVEKMDGKTIVIKIKTLIDLILSKREEGTKPIFVLDSLTSIMEGAEINNAEKIAPVLYSFNNYANTNGITIIIIDHSTRNSDHEDGFKLEGNEGGKKRTTVTTSKYLPINPLRPEKGGVFKCERARGNTGGLRVGDTIEVMSITADDAIEWFKSEDNSSRNKFLTDEFTRTQFTKITEHHRDRWIRQFRDDIFASRKDGRATIYWYENV